MRFIEILHGLITLSPLEYFFFDAHYRICSCCYFWFSACTTAHKFS